VSADPPPLIDPSDELGSLISADALLTALLEQEAVGVTVVDRDLRIVRSNRAFGIFGDRTLDEVRGLPIGEVLPALAAQIEPETRHVLETGEPVAGDDVIARHPTDPSRTRHFRAYRSPVLAADGSVVGCATTVMEVSDLRRAQDERALALDRYQTIFDSAAMGILRTDPSGRLIEANAAIEQMLGYSAAELETMRFSEYTHPDDLDENLRLFGLLVSGEIDTFRYEKRCIRKDGELVWIRVTSVAERTADAMSTVTMLEDITERKLAEEKLAHHARRAEHQALHDALTGLANRRKLFLDVARALDAGEAGARFALAIFDLDGFKSYNDVFGHPAGDALLERLARRLRESIGERASAYRMGGDEFCVFASSGDLRDVVEDARLALSDQGDGFLIRCSSGSAELPIEATTLDAALQLADERLYADKRAHKPSERDEAHPAVAGLLGVRGQSGGLDVAELAAATATRLGLSAEDVACTRIAAQLHDIGKTAVPDAILAKPGPLDSEEWAFMRRHTLIGERIVAATPALARIAPLVRASHERPDGTGYPDGLLIEAIPIGARIVAVVDAFSAMVSERSYRQAMTVERAIEELHRCAGTQFDGAVVDAFARVVERPRRDLAA
jgi:diguanylate cyclase (GGDEF)-like protein/PAS domain S-box-containing protein